MPPYRPYISKDFPITGSFLTLRSEKEAWDGIDGRMRTAIRRAEKSAAVIKKVRGTPEELATFCEFCLNPDDIPPTLTDRYHFYFAYLQDKVVAGILIVEVGSKLFMLCHASTPVAKKENIPSLLIWHVVKQFVGKQFTRLDIGASYRPSLQKFFSGWRTQGYPIIMNPPELQPTLNLTPFDTSAFGEPLPPNPREITKNYLDAKFGDRPRTFFPKATYAIYTLIKFLKNEKRIQPDGEVWITTTTDTHFISSNVTSAIEQSVPWSRTLSDKTQAIFVNHEFGFPHPRLAELRKIATERDIPLIEDCAYGWGTEGTGTVGDYAIYSLTKAFPLQFGGYLVGHHFPHDDLWHGYGCSDKGKEEFTETHLASWVGTQANDREKRRWNYEWYENLFGKERTYFPLAPGIDPGTYVLKIESEERMKIVSEYVRSFGIECGNYWRNSAIILPVHQRLLEGHLEYIAGTVFATEREWCGIAKHP